VSDYRVVRPFAWEGQLYNPGRPDPAPEQSGRGTDHPRVAVAELLHGRDDAHRDTRAAAEPELARRVEVSPLARVCRHGEIVPAGGSCSRCQAEKRGALPASWEHVDTRLRQRAPESAEEARSSRRLWAGAVCPLRQGHPSRHAVGPRAYGRQDGLPRSRARGMQSGRESDGRADRCLSA
jgi:hypothetical protein